MELPEERIWILLSRKFSNAITEAERAELNQLLRQHPDAQYTFDILNKIWEIPSESIGGKEDAGRDSSFNAMDWEKGIEKPKNKHAVSLHDFNRKKRSAIRFTAAAGILLIAGALFFSLQQWFPLKSKTEILDTYTISTKAGEKKQVVLPDGTKVWLNAVSKLSYPVSFATDSIRSVTLTGEAFFEVKHDNKHPFVVHTKKMDIWDLGTTFNVKSYPGESVAEASLISGIIEVKIKNRDSEEQKIRLKPKEKIVVYQNKHFEKYSNADSLKKNIPIQDIQVNGYRIIQMIKNPMLHTFPENAWLQNELVFKNEPFEHLVKTMERKYAMKIVITDIHIKQYQLTGIFKDESIEQALKELQVIAPFEYWIKDSVVTIY